MLGHWSVDLVVTVLLLAVMVRPLPMFPDLMREGVLDSINRAVANGLLFGRDVIMTHGPYAPVYTSQYYPGTEFIRLMGQTLIALSYAAALLSLFAGLRRLVLIPFVYLMTVVERPLFSDAVFFVLPWLFVLLAFRYASDAGGATNWRVYMRFALMVVTLSLIALVKASFTVVTFSLVALGLFLVGTRSKRLSLCLGAGFVLALLTFWLFVGQPVLQILNHFRSQLPMVSGYTDAMSTTGRMGEVGGYLILSFLAVGSLVFWLRNAQVSTVRSISLVLGLVGTLLIACKAGFVRHTAHGMISADAIALTCATLVALLPGWNGATLFAMSFAFWGWVNAYYSHLPVPWLPHPRLNPLTRAYWSDLLYPQIEGIRCKLDAARLEAHYRTSQEALVAQIRLPAVSGPTDIQESRYDLLEANGIEPKQRPIVESYSTYTPELARSNARHFESEDRPQNIFFAVMAVDGRLPSLEDSLCWPLWLSLYELDAREAPPYVILRRRNGTFEKPEFVPVHEQEGRLGEEVSLPRTDDYLWAEIELPAAPLGSAVSTLYKRPWLWLTYRYSDGHTEQFRYVAQMGKAGFVISPVVHDNAEFLALHAGRFDELAAQRPVSFSLATTPRGAWFWPERFRVRFSSPRR